ncbi:MAG: hypothetical protein AAF152_02355 [Cyanobacteria bacterium P01_A01_bin.114]
MKDEHSYIKTRQTVDGVDVEGKLRVMIKKDGDMYTAMCVDLYYNACGSTFEEAQKNFAIGLMETAAFQMDYFGDLTRLMRPPSDEVLAEFEKARKSNTVQPVAADTSDAANEDPFDLLPGFLSKVEYLHATA